MAWVEYPVQTPTGNYVKARYDPATGQVQANNAGNWVDIGTSKEGQSQANNPSWNWAMPSPQQVWTIQQTQAAQTGASPAQAGTSAPTSYLGGQKSFSGTAPGSVPGTGQSTMTWNQVGTSLGLSQADINAFTNQGFSPDQVYTSFQSTGKPPTAASAAAQAPTGPAQQPETIGLQQMAQIDPVSEALRQGLGASYLQTLGQSPGMDLSRGAVAPAAGDVQSYLDLYKQIDPTGAAAREKLLSDLSAQEALGTQLDPATIRELQQSTRAAQTARGNVYGTPQLVQEAMTRGQAGLALQQQRQGALQSYLSSGQTMGDVANSLYGQGFNRYLQARGAQQQAQGAALGYLGSGQTPYQAGASYYDRAMQAAAMAAQGGPQYNPAALGQQYSGTAQQFPTYGLEMSQNAGNWYNNINQANLQAYGLGQAYGGQSGGQKAMNVGAGALSGAASGALAGSAAGGVGAPVGAIIGGITGAASSYFK